MKDKCAVAVDVRTRLELAFIYSNLLRDHGKCIGVVVLEIVH
jgi:hypothetical protein